MNPKIGHNWRGANLFEIGGGAGGGGGGRGAGGETTTGRIDLGWWTINNFASTFFSLIILYILQF